jgi:hypothetical protein
MTHEAPLQLPLPVECDPALLMPSQVSPAPPPHHDLVADPDQVRALEAVFAAKEKESATVAGLLSLWTSAMLLSDLAVDTFKEPAGEVEIEKPQPREEPPAE